MVENGTFRLTTLEHLADTLQALCGQQRPIHYPRARYRLRL